MNKRRFFCILVAAITLLSLLTLTACGPSVQDEEDPEAAEAGMEEDLSDAPDDPEDPQEAEEEKVAQTVYIRSKMSGLNVRSGAGSAYASQGKLDKGDMTLYLGTENDGWHRTYYKGKTAYVSAAYSELLSMNSASERIEGVLALGAKLLGTPYVYGAERLHYGDGVINKKFNIGKFDCSSYTQYMFYFGADILLGTTTRSQIKQGFHGVKPELQRGDLLFFTNAPRYYNTGIERVGHVAVYLGDNYILHTASDYAVIEKISSTRWGYYIEARRFI